MKERIYKIIENKRITHDVCKIVLEGDTSSIVNSGQFVNIKINDLYLRRPISICDYDDKTITLIYKVVGKGTKVISRKRIGTNLNLLLPLGNGYNINKEFEKVVLIGGGVGIPPLYNLCKKLISINKKVTVILGFNYKSEIFYEDEFKKLGADVIVTTVNGSYGKKGFVTDALKDVSYDYFYTCGPLLMLKAVYSNTNTSGQFSFEEKMGCGFGVCMGCSCKTITGYKRICKDGPVLEKEEILW